MGSRMKPSRNVGSCLDFFVLLQPAPYLACPPLCPYDCLSGNVVLFFGHWQWHNPSPSHLVPCIFWHLFDPLDSFVFSSSGLWTIESASHWDSLGSFGPGPVSAWPTPQMAGKSASSLGSQGCPLRWTWNSRDPVRLSGDSHHYNSKALAIPG